MINTNCLSYLNRRNYGRVGSFSSAQGLTLVETMVGTVVLVVLLGIALQIYGVSLTLRQRTQLIQQAIANIQDDAERIHAMAQQVPTNCPALAQSGDYALSLMQAIRQEDLRQLREVSPDLQPDSQEKIGQVTRSSRQLNQTTQRPLPQASTVTVQRQLTADLEASSQNPDPEAVEIAYTALEIGRQQPLATMRLKVLPNAALVCS